MEMEVERLSPASNRGIVTRQAVGMPLRGQRRRGRGIATSANSARPAAAANSASPLYRPKLSSHSYRAAVGGPVVEKYRKRKVVDMTEQSDPPKAVGFFKLFTYATWLDWLLIFFGSLGAILHGIALPIAMNIFGDITNAFVSHDSSRSIVQLSTVTCPQFNINSTTRNSPFIQNFSTLVGGTNVDCSGVFTYIDPSSPSVICSNFTLTEVLQQSFSSVTTCLDDNLFISEVNFQIYIFIGVAFAVLLVGIVQVWFYQTAAESQVHRIRLCYYKAILRQDIAWFDSNPTGGVASRLSNDLDKIYQGIGDNLALMLQWMSTFLAAFGVGFYRDWRLTLVLIGMTPFMAVSGGALAKLGGVFSSREQKFYAAAGAVAEEVLSMVHTIFAFGGEYKESKRYDSHLAAAGKQGALKGLAVGLGISSIYLITFLVYAVSFWFGAYLIQEELAQAGDVITVFFGILIGAFYIGQAGPNLQKLVQAQGAAGAVYQVIERIPLIDSGSEEGKKLEKLIPTIELKNVGFAYPSRQDVQILNGLNLMISAGQRIGVVGASGSGKSTVVELIQRFYDPTDGEVLVGGVNIKELNLKWLRSHIGVVSQEPVLFDTTIAENIRYGKEDATMEEIQEAAKSANAHDFITSLPDGYNSLVGEDGELLSGGQKQRITIARALVRNPSILLLDEATSSLDSQSERIVQNALDSACQGRTTITIAHRLSTIQNADVIVAIGDGKVAEMGTHMELLEQQGIYHDLVQAQSISDEIPREKIKHRKTQRALTKRERRQSVAARSPGHTLRRNVTQRTMKLVRTTSATFRGQSRRNRSRTSRAMSSPRKKSPSETSPEKSEQGGDDQAIEMTGANDANEVDDVASPSKSYRSLSKDSGHVVIDKEITAVEVEPRRSKYPELADTEEEEENLPDVSIREIFHLNRHMWWVILLGSVAALVAGTVWPAMAIVFGEVLDVFSRPANEVLAGTHPWGGTFVALGVAAAIAVLIKNLAFTVAGESLTKSVRSLLFKSLLRQEVGWFDDVKNNTAALTNRLSVDASRVQGAAGIRLGTLIESLTGMLVALAVAFAYSWIMAFLVVAFLPVIVVSSSLHFSLAAGSNRRTNKALKESTEIAVESIENIRTVATLGLEEKFYREFDQEVTAPYQWSLFYAFVYGITYGISQSTIYFTYIISFRFGAFLVTFPQDHLLYTQFQDVFRVFAAVIFAALGVGATASFAPDYNQAKKSAKFVFSIINREPLIDNLSDEGAKPKQVGGNISASDVFFAYPERQSVNVLAGLNLSVNQGKTLAIVGSSGSGKSTIFALLERFYDPRVGCLMVDGLDVCDLSVRWLREKIGIVPQEPDLLEGSIAENIRYGALFREVSDEEVIEAAKSANIHSFIESLPQGYSTEVGAKGTQLSGGQKQRIAIARALIRDPKILLLDEATSALDTESEKVVQEALDKAREGRTSIVIAHRLSTVYNADQIIVIKRGKVAEQGTHSELLAKKGIYYKLNRLQLQDWSNKPPVDKKTSAVSIPPAVTNGQYEDQQFPGTKL